ncbi:MAG: hypothetical protein EON54_15850 [Alcaligenaceae bacterium]|nr:MAG: hypothetical protein EON54_15850 [Alcaligenaceae bacterium]
MMPRWESTYTQTMFILVVVMHPIHASSLLVKLAEQQALIMALTFLFPYHRQCKMEHSRP